MKRSNPEVAQEAIRRHDQKQTTIGQRGPWTKAEIKVLLETKDEAVERAIIALYKRQTNGERHTFASVVRNGAGFNSHDAGYFTKLAKQLQRRNVHLSKKVMFQARPRVMKYAGQLRLIANGKLSEMNC